MKKFTNLLFYAGLVLYFISGSVSGQPIKPSEIEQKFYQTKKISDEMKKNYSWNVRTDVTKDGKVVDIMIEEYRYAQDGKLERKLINNEESKLPTSFLVHMIAEEMKTKLVKFMNGLHLYLQEYAFNNQSEGILFFSKATIESSNPLGQVMVSSDDIICHGDRIEWWIDTRNFSLAKSSIMTTFEGDDISFKATYKYLHPGLNYMAFAEVIVPDKNIMVQLHFYDYTKID